MLLLHDKLLLFILCHLFRIPLAHLFDKLLLLDLLLIQYFLLQLYLLCDGFILLRKFVNRLRISSVRRLTISDMVINMATAASIYCISTRIFSWLVLWEALLLERLLLALSLVYPFVDNIDFLNIGALLWCPSSCDKRFLPDFPFSCLEVPRAPLYFWTPIRNDPCFEFGSILGESIETSKFATANLFPDNNGLDFFSFFYLFSLFGQFRLSGGGGCRFLIITETASAPGLRWRCGVYLWLTLIHITAVGESILFQCRSDPCLDSQKCGCHFQWNGLLDSRRYAK